MSYYEPGRRGCLDIPQGILIDVVSEWRFDSKKERAQDYNRNGNAYENQ
jgi:hypothetical protein